MGLIILDSIASGILTGGVYALIAVGLSLIFGVMRVLNFAHGDFIMLAMYLAFFLSVFSGLIPLLTLPLAVAVFFLFGVGVYVGVIKRIVAAPTLSQVFLTFGLSLVLENTANIVFGSNYRNIITPYSGKVVSLLNLVTVSLSYLIAFSISIVVMVSLSVFLARTKLGMAVRAVAQDVESAILLGIDVERVRTFTFGLGIGLAGGAGVLLATLYYIYPYVAMPLTIDSFIITVLGGMGSIPGAMLGGIILGVIQSVGPLYTPTGFQQLWGLVMFLLILRLKPSGLLGRSKT
jgi:branched-chain amino acid transport system permease protein